MYNKPFYLSVFVLVAVAFNLKAQEPVKPRFKQLMYVEYETHVIKSNEVAEITAILTINAAGLVHLQSKYYNGVADTTYHLSNDLMNQLNDVADGSKKLKTNMVADKLPAGHHFGGNFEFLSAVSNAGKKDELIVVAPFMTGRFNKLMEDIWINPSAADTKVKNIKDPELSARIIALEKQCTYLPKIEQPPTIMEIAH
jgi:hypothetical protein